MEEDKNPETLPIEPQTEKSDESISFGMAIKDNILIIDFGTPVMWIGLTRIEVIGLRDALNKQINLLH